MVAERICRDIAGNSSAERGKPFPTGKLRKSTA